MIEEYIGQNSGGMRRGAGFGYGTPARGETGMLVGKGVYGPMLSYADANTRRIVFKPLPGKVIGHNGAGASLAIDVVQCGVREEGVGEQIHRSAGFLTRPSFFILLCSVLGFRPSSSAAPPGPYILPCARSRVAFMCWRSTS